MWEKTKQIFLDSIERSLAAIAGFLPALLAMVLLLVASTLVALMVRFVVRRLFLRANLDQRLRAWGVAAPASQGRASPSMTITRFVFWTVTTLGCLVGLSAFDATGTAAKQLLNYLPKALAGLAIFVVGLSGSRALERSVLISAVNAGLSSARVIALGGRWLVVVLAAAMALEQLGVGGTILVVSFAMIFGGIVLSLSLAIGLGARTTVARSLERAFPSTPEPPKEREKNGDAQSGEYHHM